CPHVQVVYFSDAADPPHRADDCRYVDVGWSPLKQDIDCISDQLPGAVDDQDCDSDADQRVGYQDPFNKDQQPGDNCTQRAHGIAYYVQERGAHVHVFFGSPMQQAGADTVHHQAADPDDGYFQATYRLRCSDPLYGLEENQQAYNNEGDSIGQCCQDL